MDSDKEEFSDPDNSDQGSDYDSTLDPVLDPDSPIEEEEEEDEDGCIFNTWMHRCRGEEETEEGSERTRSSDVPNMRTGRRASLPCTEALSSLRLHVSTPITAKRLLRRESSRRLLQSPQDVPPPPGERRQSLQAPPTIAELSITKTQNLQKTNFELTQNWNKVEKPKHFRRRNVMSLSDAESLCLICHNELKIGAEGTRELQCSHTFHKECIEEFLWRKQHCPTCHVHVSLPQNLLWTNLP